MNPLVTLPELKLTVAGKPVVPQLQHAISSVSVEQVLSQPSQCSIVFESPDPAIRQVLAGSTIEISVLEENRRLFVGVIVSIVREYNSVGALNVILKARDALDALHKKQSRRVLEKVSTRAVIEAITADHKLQVTGDTGGPVWYKLIQYQRSDFDFLYEIASCAGLFFFVSGSTLRLLTLEGYGSVMDLVSGQNLLEVGFDDNVARKIDTVSVTGWDPWRAVVVTGNATHARTGRKISQSIVQSHGQGEVRIVADRAWQSTDQAEACAQAVLDTSVANEHTAYGVAEGNPALQPGSLINISGLEDPGCGQYVLSHVTHTIDIEHGYITRFDTASPPLPRRTEAGSITMGQVERVDDPEKLGRVKVALVCYDGMESDWLEVLLPAAGANKGLVALPGQGDTVLVALIGTDPSQGIVIGSLFGETKPADTGVEGNQVRRYSLRTPGGQVLSLEDKKNRIKIEHDNGSYIELDEEKMTMHSSKDMTIEAPGRTLNISAKSIDFEQS